MSSTEQLARTAYEAFAQAQAKCYGKNPAIDAWECLKAKEKAAWVASVQAVRNELAEVH